LEPATSTARGNGPVKDSGEMVSENLSELRDRESRKENLVLFNIPESTSDDTDSRKLYDIAQTTELLESELNVQTEVANPVRLGKKQQNSRFLGLCVSQWKVTK